MSPGRAARKVFMSAAMAGMPSPAPQRSFVVVVFARWLPLAVAVTVLSLLIYAAVQQAHRSAANDPQNQLAEDGAHSLAGGAAPAEVVGPRTVDIAASLAPWVMVVDGSNHVVASSARLDGRVPAIPAGVLDVARRRGGNGVTWQPRPGVRSATVEVAVAGGRGMVVVSGRSLREVEVREDRLWVGVCVAWLVAMAGTLVAAVIGVALAKEPSA
jgi:hypothetical protein